MYLKDFSYHIHKKQSGATYVRRTRIKEQNVTHILINTKPTKKEGKGK